MKKVDSPCEYDVLVVGAGHAGCEAALAAARMGCRTGLVGTQRESIATLPCNPSIGGLAKSHLVVELDVLGGEMAGNADATGIQYRVLNASRGPAVRATRIQCDKQQYARRMQSVLKQTLNLSVIDDEVQALWLERGVLRGVVGRETGRLRSTTVVLCTGTALEGSIHVGAQRHAGAGDGRPAAVALGQSLRALGLELRPLKTGTPPRLDLQSLDLAACRPQGSDLPLPFLAWRNRFGAMFHVEPSDAGQERAPKDAQIPSGAPMFHVEHWRSCVDALAPWPLGSRLRDCWMTHTTAETHRIIRAHLKQSARYGGYISATGVRYCPSIEDKIVKFPDHPSHAVYLEPEGLQTPSVYVNGTSNSLPPPIQEAFIRTIPGLARARFLQYGYAIVYAALDPRQLTHTLEARACPGLYCAGQLNGTTGYEEAAAQGFMAGVNAALRVQGRPPLVLDRADAYIGVLIDDLVTKGTDEPYRMFTSRAEYRLRLRPDNAWFRLRDAAASIGIASRTFLDASRKTEARIDAECQRLSALRDPGGTSWLSALARPGMCYLAVPGADPSLPPEVVEQIETQARYAGYLEQERQAATRAQSDAGLNLPAHADYRSIAALRFEAREKLDRVRPATLAQAARIPGVNPADLSILSILLRNGRLPLKPD